MIAILNILLNIHLLPMPAHANYEAETRQVEVKQISAVDDLAIFSENFFNKPFNDLVLKNHTSPADMAETGLIENGIYFVYDKKGNSLGVLKVMPMGDLDDEILFEEEFSALNHLRNLKFKHFHLVNLFGRAQGVVAGEDSLVLAESVAPGKTMNSLIREYGKSVTPIGKRQAFEKLKAGVKETAVAMAELHNKSPKLKANPYYLKKYSGYLPGPWGIIHGDAHPGNIFYDQATNQTTFIDFQMTPDLALGGPVGYDVANFMTTMEILGQYKDLSEAQTKEMSDLFLNTYRKSGSTLTANDVSYYQQKIYKRYASIPESEIDGPDAKQLKFIKSYCQTRII